MPFQAPADGVLLPPYRILDLTGPEGVFCGKLLADYGADVIKIEPPGGDPTRQRAPFIGDQPGPERSSYFLFYNTNKRSVTLDLENVEGRELFKKMAASADVLIESFPVGYMKRLGLDFDTLKTDNPGLVMASITPFGQTGPWKDFLSTDLISAAALIQHCLTIILCSLIGIVEIGTAFSSSISPFFSHCSCFLALQREQYFLLSG